jgi:hypothetical protein
MKRSTTYTNFNNTTTDTLYKTMVSSEDLPIKIGVTAAGVGLLFVIFLIMSVVLFIRRSKQQKCTTKKGKQ